MRWYEIENPEVEETIEKWGWDVYKARNLFNGLGVKYFSKDIPLGTGIEYIKYPVMDNAFSVRLENGNIFVISQSSLHIDQIEYYLSLSPLDYCILGYESPYCEYPNEKRKLIAFMF